MIDDKKENINSIIKKLGYEESENLYYYKDLLTNTKLNIPLQTQKTLRDIKPSAFYCIDNKPFILFFSIIKDKQEREKINKKYGICKFQ